MIRRLLLAALVALALFPAAAPAQVITSTPPSCAAPPGNTTLPVLNCGLGDIKLFRDAANTLALRNGVNGQALNIYNTYTDASNYERGVFDWSTQANVLTIGVAKAGTGSARDVNIRTPGTIYFQPGALGTAAWDVSTNGHLLAFSDNLFDIGASGANRPRDLYLARNFTAGGSVTAATTGFIQWGSRSVLQSPADGNIELSNSSVTSFGLLQFGGTTSSFPALKRNGTGIDVRLADDSGYGAFAASTVSTTTSVISGTFSRTGTTTVTGLGSAATAGAGARWFVTDATACTFNATPTGGGAVSCPVWSDGASWKIG